MKIKVIRNGVEGFQLQHLKDSGEIKNVRPATVEEFNLYESLSRHMGITKLAYQRAKTAEESLASLKAKQDRLDERVELAERAKERAEAALKKANVMMDEADAELEEQRKRAEAAEQALVELRDALKGSEESRLLGEQTLAEYNQPAQPCLLDDMGPAPEAENIPEGWVTRDGMPNFESFEAHNGR